MARLEYLSREQLEEKDQALLDRPTHYYRALAHHPEALRAFSQVAMWLRWSAALDPRLRELVILQVAYASNCGYEFAHHVGLAEEFGVEPADIDALLREDRGLPNRLREPVRTALRAAKSLTVEGHLQDEDWERLHSTLGTEQCLELVLTVTYYNHVVRASRALQVDLEPEYAGVLDRYPPASGTSAWG